MKEAVPLTNYTCTLRANVWAELLAATGALADRPAEERRWWPREG